MTVRKAPQTQTHSHGLAKVDTKVDTQGTESLQKQAELARQYKAVHKTRFIGLLEPGSKVDDDIDDGMVDDSGAGSSSMVDHVLGSDVRPNAGDYFYSMNHSGMKGETNVVREISYNALKEAKGDWRKL